MDGERALRACMQALVLLDLAFVQLTGAAGLQWLAPLYALTLAAPALARFRERPAYRLAWNAGVVGFFLLLLRHAQRADLANVLEGGLVLAVLCQVHLLNNLRADQRPDLLFFNAFLIAIVSAFMSPGAAFVVAFLAFAPFYVVGLQLLAAARGGPGLDRTAARAIALDGARRAALLLLLSLLVFAAWPRDFERKAFFHGRIEIGQGSGDLEIGFNEELELDRRGDVDASDRPALRVTLLEGDPGAVPTLWRGATLGATDGGGWRPLAFEDWRAAGSADASWREERGSLVRGAATAPSARARVLRHRQGTERLFAPLGASELVLAPESADAFLRTHLDGTLDSAETGDLTYDLALGPARAGELGGARRTELPPELAPYVELPETDRTDRALDLAASLTAGLPEDVPQHELVARLSEHLEGAYAYVAPGTEGAATTLNEFLSSDAGGHCEFFASALATMLRGLDVPCRVVTGYRSTRWEGRTLRFALRDAHAWVEVHDPRGGWYAVDPSPLVAASHEEVTLWARVRTGVGRVWTAITGFDAERRAQVLAAVRALPGRLAGAVADRPAGTAATLLLAAGALALLRSRRLARQSAVRAYRRALRRAGLRERPGETPRELLGRAREAGLDPERLRPLELATHRHEEQRYAARAAPVCSASSST